MIRALIACEKSQRVTKEMRDQGIEAFSCDIDPAYGGYSKWHIQCDARRVLGDGWDILIAFPPCTHLTASGARYFEEKRVDGRQREAIDLFMSFVEAPCEYIAIENPVGIMSTLYRKPDQIIQPWMFGHKESKSTCLWLKNLPRLKPTCVVEPKGNKLANIPPSPLRGHVRSITFRGVAKAMAEQWGGYVKQKLLLEVSL